MKLLLHIKILNSHFALHVSLSVILKIILEHLMI